jgi:plastocyanin
VSVHAALVAAGTGLLLSPGCARVEPVLTPTDAPGDVEGRIRTALESAWTVVYLDAPDDEAAPRRGVATLRRDAEGFSPPLLAVGLGQPVELQSADGIHHRFFSYSRPNQFDVGLVRSGESARVAFSEPGLVQVYCSLHPGEQASIFVVPSPYYTAVQAPGPYAIRGVPPGSYALHAWSESHALSSRRVTVRSGRATSIEIGLGAPETRP